MKIATMLMAVLAYCGICSAAEQANTAKLERDSETLLKSHGSPVLAALSYANWTYFTSITIPANGYTYLDTNIDFSSSTSVSISVISANADISYLTIAPSWTASGVPFFMPSTSQSGVSFPFSDSGAAYFAVSGTQVRVFLYNRLSTPMTLKAVYIYTNSI